MIAQCSDYVPHGNLCVAPHEWHGCLFNGDRFKCEDRECEHSFGADCCDISGELCKVKARKENCNMKGDQDGENDNSSNTTG